MGSYLSNEKIIIIESIKKNKKELKINQKICKQKLKESSFSKEDFLEMMFLITNLEEMIKLEKRMLKILNKSKEDFIKENLNNRNSVYFKELTKMESDIDFENNSTDEGEIIAWKYESSED